MPLRILLPAILLLGCSSRGNAQSAVENHLTAISWEGYQDEAVQLFRQYLRIDTSNPPGNEAGAAEFFHRLFDRAGIPNTIYTYAPGRANIFACLKGDGSRRPIVLLSHMDVVRAESSNWKAPPFSADIVDGEIYGRGALDMKDEGMIHAMVLLIAAREHLPLKRDLIFLATADEEVGDTGSAWILEHHPELVRDAEYLITEGGSNLVYPHRGTIYGIGVGEKAPFWIRMTATGRGGHGSIPIADSAPNHLARAMQRVVDWQPPIRLLPEVEEYFNEMARLESEPRASQFRNLRASLRDPVFAHTLLADEDVAYMLHDTIALTVMKGSEQTNVIPDTASCELDVRLLPGRDPKDFLAELRAVVNDDRIKLEPISDYRTPNSSSTDTELYRLIKTTVGKYNPEALVVPSLNSGYTESQMYRPLGIRCYGFAPIEIPPELDATQHAANERIPEEQFRRGVKMLYEIVARAAGD
jgi:acetylornithine deacetylase/succinyl-diaminopimelate desuccinylase-like protein